MSKRTTRLLSLILTLVMFLSLSTPAFAWGPGDVGSGWGHDIGDDDVRDFDVEPDEEFEEEYDYFQALDEENNVQVTIEAPMGALPSLAEVRLEAIPAEDLQDAVDEVVDGNARILVAMDISFWLGEDEIEPEEPVRVKISAPELEGKSNLQVIHFPDDDAEEPESIELIGEEDLSFALGTNEIAFQADSFSVYVVVDEGSDDEDARLTINFYNLDWNTTTPIATMYIKNSDELLGDGERQEAHSYIEDIVYDPGIGDSYTLGSNMFRGWSIDAADANPQPVATEENPNPAPITYGPNYSRDTKVYTIDDITTYLAGRLGKIQEGQVLNIYAMIFQTYTIAYYGMSTEVSMGMHTVFAPLNANAEAPYQIDMTFTPEDNEHFFEGWKILEGGENIVSATAPDGTPITGRIPIADERPDADPPVVATVFPDKTQLVVKGDVSFTVSQPAGHWLIFKENGKGARFNAPQFVKNGETTFQPTNALPANMTRNGYDFAGWYELEVTYDSETNRAIPVTDDDGNYVFKSDSQYVFGQTLSKETIIAAKWTPRENSPYNVIIWVQKPGGEGYDFKEAIPFTGKTGDPINVITQDGATVQDANADGTTRSTRNVKVNGAEKAYEGFHVGSFDTGKTIAAEGNTVVNVYYDRNNVLLRFNLYSSSASYEYTKISSIDEIPEYSSTGTFYILYEGEYQSVTLSRYDGRVILQSGGSWYYLSDDYLDSIYTRTTIAAGWRVYKSFIGLYGSTLAENNVEWPTEYNWYAEKNNTSANTSSTRTTFLDAFIPASTSMIVDYYGASTSGTYHVYFYQQDATGSGYTQMNDVLAGSNSGINFNLSDKYTGFQCAQWSDDGSTWHDVGELMTVNNDLYYDAHPETDGYQYVASSGNVYIRFNRLSYPITYFDGTYFDGNNNVLKDVDKVSSWGVSDDIMYGADIKTYGQRYLEDGTTPNPNYKIPVREGYAFEGWYADETCTTLYDFDTMPLGGVTVYARWRKIQYRVFLRTNVPTDDNSLDWGSDDQSMNFRITQGDYVSLPTGTRTGYVFVGWFYDDDFDDVFNSEVVPLTDDNVVDDYDKTDRLYMTDNAKMITKPDGTQDNKPINKWGFLDDDDAGVNKDVKRFWITKKLDLYAKWKAILDGAEGISVLYDEVPLAEGQTEQSGHGVTGSAPGDGNRLYEDNSKAIAQGASKALAADEQFLYWVVQKWDKDQKIWVDVIDAETNDTIKVYPGDNFLVKEAYARITPDTQNPGKNFYEVQLRAEYGKKDGPEPTHITWYSNEYDVAGNQFLDADSKDDMVHPETAVWDDDGGWSIVQTEVQINKAVEIPAPPYSYEGYTFLGWGRVCDPDSLPDGAKEAYVTDPAELSDEDLYIKWVPGENGAAGHYEAYLPKDKLSRDYYIVGYINGTDYSGDAYKVSKSSGKITVTFSQKGYLAVKNSDNHWYKMYNGDFSDPAETPSSGSANLYDEGGNNTQKIPVPAGVELTITLEEIKRADGTIDGVKISYSAASASEPSGNVVPLRDGETAEEYEWKTVQYVAADEEKPYHDMYAMWGGEFHVYHSGIAGGAIETYQITRDNKTLDLTRYYVASRDGSDPHAGEYQNSGFLYGGYYLEGGFTAPIDTSSAGSSEGTTTGPKYLAYNGSNWTWTKPETEAGNAITPKGGVTYYIKEVPASMYLQPYFHFTYLKESDPANQVLRSGWLISDIDDCMYKETGFVIQTADKTAYVCTQLTVQNAVGGASVVLKPQNIFRGQGVSSGYLSYLEVMKDGACTNGMGTTATVLQYWVTPDNMIVTGTTQRVYGNLSTKADVANGVVPTTVASTIGVFSGNSTQG